MNAEDWSATRKMIYDTDIRVDQSLDTSYRAQESLKPDVAA